MISYQNDNNQFVDNLYECCVIMIMVGDYIYYTFSIVFLTARLGRNCVMFFFIQPLLLYIQGEQRKLNNTKKLSQIFNFGGNNVNLTEKYKLIQVSCVTRELMRRVLGHSGRCFLFLSLMLTSECDCSLYHDIYSWDQCVYNGLRDCMLLNDGRLSSSYKCIYTCLINRNYTYYHHSGPQPVRVGVWFFLSLCGNGPRGSCQITSKPNLDH